MKIFLKNIFLLLAVSNLIFSQIENSDDWTKGGEATLLFNQTSFSEWVSGGENSISLSFHADYDLNYEKNGWKWDTKFLGDFGLTKISGSKFLRKTNDKFDLQSLLGKSFSERWSYSTVFGVKTQFAKGFTYGENDDGKEVKTLKTQFFSPVYIQLGVGLYWKKDDKLWVNIAPFTQRLTLVSRKFTMNLTDGKEYFGVKKGENHRFELGASVSAFYSFTPMENLELEQRLGLYSDYLGKAENVDLDYLISAKMKVNEKISTNLIIQLVYDDNAVQKLQTRQIFGIGVNIKLN
ncbi:MAG: DUF3078 domain-containing protein [Bacteroidota bacterium]|nr:DUF3078 domain-containing protein [Bacteroidota bacterium]